MYLTLTSVDVANNVSGVEADFGAEISDSDFGLQNCVCQRIKTMHPSVRESTHT